ncbi:MAG TPA: MOSC N-terminal beta barrel domain-containing protein [Terriglobia bacterium]|nr:MOSC N-terminal beta barrel domain-containing protein [Terriglobia bacterium]
MQTVGVIRQLARFPVKSMRGEALPATKITLQGVPGDRRYAFVQTASRSSFPWFTAREMPELLCYRTSVEATDSPDAAVTVTTPSGQIWRIESEELRRELEARSGREIFLLRDHRGSYDAAPVSLISCQTVARIAEESGTQEDPWRFRPNLLIDLTGGDAFHELSWVGRILRVGDEARIAITETDQRCMMITLDPATAKASPAVMKYVTQQHGQSAGVYATVIKPGEVRLADPVTIEG